LAVLLIPVVTSSCGGGESADEGAEQASSSQPLATTAPSDTSTTSLPPLLEIEEGEALSGGAEGPSVRALQEALAALGYDPGASDGVFGPATRSAVMDFQRSKRLEPDGVAGERTLTAINEAPSSSAAENRATSSRPVDLTRHSGIGVVVNFFPRDSHEGLAKRGATRPP
jgi:peptidoglycan hydrolase-like protein with peptidoglycan-binding domain